MAVIFTCLQCHTTFKAPPTRRDTAKYCSMQCYARAKDRRLEHTCTVCHATFEDSPSQRRKYCSKQCQHRASRGRVMARYTCVLCQTKFEAKPSRRAKYCSPQCNYRAKQKRLTHTCAFCSTEFEGLPSCATRPARKYCSTTCQAKASRGSHYRAPSQKAFYKQCGLTFGAKPSETQKHYSTLKWRRLRIQICERDNYQCQICSKHLAPRAHNMHVDHKVPIRLGGADIPENLWCLCSSCHRKKDAHLQVSGRMF